MVEVRVKTLWQGKVGIREQFVTEALRLNSGLLIRHKKDSMPIPADKVKEMIDSYSTERFKDFYGQRKPERLIYYAWKPLVKQGALL